MGYVRQHVADCRAVARLLRRAPSMHLENLWWYDLPVRYAASWRGIAHVLRNAATSGRFDKTAAQHGLRTLYAPPPQPLPPVTTSKPTVWHCRTLPATPWHDGTVAAAKAILESKVGEVRDEFLRVRDRVRTHPDNASLATSGRWGALFLYGTRGRRDDDLCALCPTTTKIVERLRLCRNFGFVMFSELAPGTHVAPHTGSSNLRVRCHLPLIAPEPDMVTLTVAGETRGWREGQCLAFDDSFVHEVRHSGRQRRVILSVDVWHPSLGDADVLALSHDVFGRFGRHAAGGA
jgi:Aspartyl/Asparaginyl beta-hydroxylase